MDWDKYKNFLLSNIPEAVVASGGTAINCRCRECPDSNNPNSKHFYISIPYQNDKPSLYYCHKCGCSGFIDHKTLLSWGIYDKDIAIELDKYNSGLKLNTRNTKYFGNVNYSISNTITNNDDQSIRKLKYICDRIGYNLSFDDLKQLKIVLNLSDLLNENRITKYTRDHNVLQDLDREFIGFLSIDNAFLNMRRTCDAGKVYKGIDMRYVNYKIFDKLDTSQRFYTIPTRVDLMTSNRIKLHIAEGPFDILSIYLNVRNREPGIYSSVAGSNYMNTILYFLLDVKIPNLEIHLYPDNDANGSYKKISKIVSMIPDPTIPVYIHRNIYPGEKDFGVPKDRIIESI